VHLRDEAGRDDRHHLPEEAEGVVGRLKALAAALALAGAAACSPNVAWLTPSEEAAPWLDAALDAWAEAGVPVDDIVYVGPGGGAVHFTDGEPRAGARGLTKRSWDGDISFIRVQRGAPARTWTHELGHVLGADNEAHTSAGACVMAAPSECDGLTAEDVALAGW
jgi:hypothetical protein